MEKSSYYSQLRIIRLITVTVWSIGFALFLFTFFVNGFVLNYLLSISASLMVSAILTLGFCLFIKIMEEASQKKDSSVGRTKQTSRLVYKKSSQLS
ncbi:hypothetical protein [Mesobacillus harenae]|uniref:hypothetical protein n=1 Tax=Mesobacillus harenae TaxID=2213203 RepID=UPI00157FBDE6|nr:hypothetical protein [Mesobacillus harenae]